MPGDLWGEGGEFHLLAIEHPYRVSPRPKRSGCAQGDRLQVGNSVSLSHSCSERNGVIADAAYPARPRLEQHLACSSRRAEPLI